MPFCKFKLTFTKLFQVFVLSPPTFPALEIHCLAGVLPGCTNLPIADFCRHPNFAVIQFQMLFFRYQAAKVLPAGFLFYPILQTLFSVLPPRATNLQTRLN